MLSLYPKPIFFPAIDIVGTARSVLKGRRQPDKSKDGRLSLLADHVQVLLEFSYHGQSYLDMSGYLDQYKLVG